MMLVISVKKNAGTNMNIKKMTVKKCIEIIYNDIDTRYIMEKRTNS